MYRNKCYGIPSVPGQMDIKNKASTQPEAVSSLLPIFVLVFVSFKRDPFQWHSIGKNPPFSQVPFVMCLPPFYT